VEVIILAAGRSTRMGGPNKLLAQHRGKALVRHVAESAVAAGIGPVSVVVGHQADQVRAALAGLDLRFIENPAFADGLSTSLRAGIGALAPDCGAAVILLGDMPLVGPAVIRRLAAAYAQTPDAKAVVPTFLGQKGNPVLIARGLFASVADVSGDIGARRLIEDAGGQVVEVAVDDPGALLDIDTPQALRDLAETGTRS
ncbi:MAG TPA: nucleotidyltransferase family protein, partial [Beijerinckiaceae bacterium]|nr:nucleotidyltransferase family protein [Beijerinckiaceae bacterium]